MSQDNNSAATITMTVVTTTVTTTTATTTKRTTPLGPALVFGASGEQGRAVIEGLVDAGHHPVYAFGRHVDDDLENANYLTDALGATLLKGDLENPDDVLNAFLRTKCRSIVLITTTDLPSEVGQTSGFSDAAEAEFQVIMRVFCLLKDAYQQDGLPRHIVFSCRENVQRVHRLHFERTGQVWMEALDDGSIVPHYSAKGRGGEFAMEYLKNTPDLKLTLITLPFLYSNFLGFFCPLPDEGKTQWTLGACFGDGKNPIDMMGTKDLTTIVPNIFAHPEKYGGKNLRLVGQRISMDQVAASFEDLFGKPVIYNPLTPAEVAAMPFAVAPAMAQMCQFVSDPRSLAHDMEATLDVLGGKKPQTFEDWLLTHSESSAFQECGLTADAPEIKKVVVFGANSPEGTSVIRGLLTDTRKEYSIRAVVRNTDEGLKIKDLAPDRVELIQVNLDDTESCLNAVLGTDGIFLVTHFLQDDHDVEAEERHIRNIIDACEKGSAASEGGVRHLVFSSLESADVVKHHLAEKDSHLSVDSNQVFDARARAAAYARTKKLSVTYILLPYYTESFLDKMKRMMDQESGQEKVVVDDDKLSPEKQDAKMVCMSIEDLGPAVANIFDSYQVYAGHEIALVTDFASYSDVKELMQAALHTGSNAAPESSPSQEKEGPTKAKHSYLKDLGQMFETLAHSDAVKMRRTVAKTMQLVPSARPLKEWIEQNRNKEAFREKLGLR